MITPDQGVIIAGRYTLVRQLAKGGMGSVWIARHRDLEIDVTVKFMAPSLVASAEARMRFEREAKLAARLRSQHVVQVHDYGVEDETPYIIMELLKGESLSTRVTREGRLAPRIVAPLVVQICKALRTAHDSGLVHRDLKPDNIFLALKDEDEVVKVLDFGIAKSGPLGEAQADTASGVLLGSVHYMSPEQIRSSRAVDHRSDLWSIAVILYRVLTGKLPFPGSNLGDVLVRVCTDATPPASQAAPDLPARIDRFFERALARDPAQRFQSASELAEAFSSMALEPPAQTPPPPQGSLLRQTTRMTPAAAALVREIEGENSATTSLPEPAAPLPPFPTQAVPLPAFPTQAAPLPPFPTRATPLPPFPTRATPLPPFPTQAAPLPPSPVQAAPLPPSSVQAAPLPPFPEQAAPLPPFPTQAAPPPPFLALAVPPSPGPSIAPFVPLQRAADAGAAQALSGADRSPSLSLPTITAGDRARKRSSWPVWAAIAMVAFAAILGLALRSSARSRDAVIVEPSAAPPSAAAEATAPLLPAPREALSAPQPLPEATAARADVGAAASAKAVTAEPRTTPSPSLDRAAPRAPGPDSPAAQPKLAPKRKTNPLDRSD